MAPNWAKIAPFEPFLQEQTVMVQTGHVLHISATKGHFQDTTNLPLRAIKIIKHTK